jgi:DNA-binding NtrC family response regulator
MTAPRSILIVDDNVDLAENIREILEDEGIVCELADNGDAAIAMLRKGRYDLVLTDLRMEGTDGIGVLREVTKCYPATPVIIMTAYARDQTVEEAREQGAMDVLPKPLDVGYLVSMIEQLTQRSRRVLLVEDDVDLRENLAELLGSMPEIEVETAHDLASARRAIAQKDYDVAVLDIRLPDGDGITLAREIAERTAKGETGAKHLVLMTAYAGVADDMVLPHIRQILEKPFAPAALVALVRKATQ